LVVKAMARSHSAFCAFVLLFAAACEEQDRLPLPPVDCSVVDAYEVKNITDFNAGDPQWFLYGDPTPGGFPAGGEMASVLIGEDEPRCGDTRFLKLVMEGKNFWGAGFADWGHNAFAGRAIGADEEDGTGPYEGIRFWARSEINSERQFFFNVDDQRTILNPPPVPDGGGLPAVRGGDQDLDGDGFVGAGDIALDTKCRLPPSSDFGEATCYNGGVDGPTSAGTRVPVPGECGNAFHTRITTTTSWQMFFIPWADLVQWPCPNRLEGGIDITDIRKFEIKFDQGTRYEIWLDNIEFYRRR
jgi:hypothetical protein